MGRHRAAHGSFMMRLRKAWNCFADFIGLVKKSARLFIGRAHERDLELERLHHVAHVAVASLYVLHPVMVLGVVGHMARTLRALCESVASGVGPSVGPGSRSPTHLCRTVC
jgi:hypothetical protein